MSFDDQSETELAFSFLSDNHCHEIERHPLVSGSDTKTTNLTSVYYDTPSRLLESTGWSVRLRNDGGGQQIQTVKGPTVTVKRPQWEIPLDSTNEGLDIEKLQYTPIWPIISNQAPSLVTVFETQVQRIIHNLRFENTQIELALDKGYIRTTQQNPSRSLLQIDDLELELKNGDVGAMFRLAIQLVLDTGITMQPASKAERGYQLINDAIPIHKHGETVLVKGTPTILGFRTLLADVLMHLRQNLNAAKTGQPNGVHQVRVAIRRLRALMVLFRPVLHRETVRSYSNELRHFAQIFGQARDWDVFLTETLPTASKAMPSSGWINLVRRVALDKQRDSHADVAATIAGKRFNTLILSLMGWAEDYPITAAPRRVYQRPIDEVMPDLLSSIASQVDKRRRRLDKSPGTIHDLRKAMKKLRYSAEFAESLYSPKAVRRFLRPCKDVQEMLGGFNDVVVTRGLLHELTALYPSVTPAIRELSFWLDERERKVISPVPKLLNRLRDDKPFWQ